MFANYLYWYAHQSKVYTVNADEEMDMKMIYFIMIILTFKNFQMNIQMG